MDQLALRELQRERRRLRRRRLQRGPLPLRRLPRQEQDQGRHRAIRLGGYEESI